MKLLTSDPDLIRQIMNMAKAKGPMKACCCFNFIFVTDDECRGNMIIFQQGSTQRLFGYILRAVVFSWLGYLILLL